MDSTTTARPKGLLLRAQPGQVQGFDITKRGLYGERPLDESLLLEFHHRIGGDRVPDWAGRWRAIEVRVGNLQPPLPHLVAQRMHDYCLAAPEPPTP